MTRRVPALARFRLRQAATGRTLLAPLVTLAAVEVVGLAGPGAPAAISVVTAVAFALPVLAWAARQVLDAEPDEQVRLSELAVGGRVRAAVAGQLAAYAVVAPLAVLCTVGALLHVDGAGVPGRVALAGLALALAGALAAVAVGALAARSVAGTGGGAVLVLVGAPVVIALVGLASSPYVTVLVPRVDVAVRAAYDGRLPAATPGAALQVAGWACVVLAVRLGLLAGRPSRHATVD